MRQKFLGDFGSFQVGKNNSGNSGMGWSLNDQLKDWGSSIEDTVKEYSNDIIGEKATQILSNEIEKNKDKIDALVKGEGTKVVSDLVQKHVNTRENQENATVALASKVGEQVGTEINAMRTVVETQGIFALRKTHPKTFYTVASIVSIIGLASTVRLIKFVIGKK